MSEIEHLQSWYARHCDGDWEHDERIRISTLDNPGWRVWVNLSGTRLEGRTLQLQSVERSEADWLDYLSDGVAFDAACGASNLQEALAAFRAFVNSSDVDRPTS